MTTLTATTDTLTATLNLATGEVVVGDATARWHGGADGWLEGADALSDEEQEELEAAIQAAIEDFWLEFSGDVAGELSFDGVEFDVSPNDDRTAVVVQATCEVSEEFDSDALWAAVDAALNPMGLEFAHESGGISDYLTYGGLRHGEYAHYALRKAEA